MRLALCTTSIHVPEALRLLRVYGPKVEFFVAGDLKTPHDDVTNLCNEIGRARYLHPDEQKQWKCSEAIGFSCIQRRNIAFLEALKWGATHIYSWDTDNVPVNSLHFNNLAAAFSTDACPEVSAESWFDVGQLLVPPAKHRGIPHDNDSKWSVRTATNVKVGVVAGACLGDPDVDAVTRMALSPTVHQTSELLRGGVVVAPDTWTVFNSQNIAFVRELAPAMFMLPGVGRFDDIFASLICQRIMCETGHCVYFGRPFTWQHRHPHNLLIDLKAEWFGMEFVERLAEHTNVEFPNNRVSVIDKLRWYCDTVYGPLPLATLQAYRLWLDDCEQVLG